MMTGLVSLFIIRLEVRLGTSYVLAVVDGLAAVHSSRQVVTVNHIYVA